MRTLEPSDGLIRLITVKETVLTVSVSACFGLRKNISNKQINHVIADQFIYWVVNLGAISIPFLFSFHPNILFYKHWKSAFAGILVTAIPFLIWDGCFTEWGVWGFNDRYITGHRLFGMPYEEWAFFICIPYACVFTYYCFRKFFGTRFQGPPSTIHYLIPVICIIFLVINWQGLYTRYTFVLLLIFYCYHIFVLKSSYLNLFLFTYGILLIPFFIVNGVLTGSGIEDEVVWYNRNHHPGFRILTVPIVDAFYGLLLILGGVTIFEKLESRRRD